MTTIWHCLDCGETFAAPDAPERCPHCDSGHIKPAARLTPTERALREAEEHKETTR